MDSGSSKVTDAKVLISGWEYQKRDFTMPSTKSVFISSKNAPWQKREMALLYSMSLFACNALHCRDLYINTCFKAAPKWARILDPLFLKRWGGRKGDLAFVVLCIKKTVIYWLLSYATLLCIGIQKDKEQHYYTCHKENHWYMSTKVISLFTILFNNE